ncbi:hypothetical protein Tco_0127224 [Tanacetum coccineum]
MVESWLKISRSRACKQAGDPVLRALVTEELLIHYESMQITDVSIKFQDSNDAFLMKGFSCAVFIDAFLMTHFWRWVSDIAFLDTGYDDA